jgi:hypothetical protein
MAYIEGEKIREVCKDHDAATSPICETNLPAGELQVTHA